MNLCKLFMLTVGVLGILSGSIEGAWAGDALVGEGPACLLSRPPSGSVERSGAVGLEITDFKRTSGNVDIILRLNQNGQEFWFRSQFLGVKMGSPPLAACALRDLMQGPILTKLGFDPSKKKVCLTEKYISKTDFSKEIMVDGKPTGRFLLMAEIHLYIADSHAKC
jgi:hypothetical protein